MSDRALATFAVCLVVLALVLDVCRQPDPTPDYARCLAFCGEGFTERADLDGCTCHDPCVELYRGPQ